MNNLLYSAMLLTSLLAASEATQQQQTDSEAESLVVILHMGTAHRSEVSRYLQALAKCPGFSSLALHVVIDNDHKSIFPSLIPGLVFERDFVEEVLKELQYLPAGEILKGQILGEIINTYKDSCPRQTVVIVTSGMYDQTEWFDNINILVVQLNKTLKNSRESWKKLIPDNVHYIGEKDFKTTRVLSKLIFGDPDACTAKGSEKFIRLCIPTTKGDVPPDVFWIKVTAGILWILLLLVLFLDIYIIKQYAKERNVNEWAVVWKCLPRWSSRTTPANVKDPETESQSLGETEQTTTILVNKPESFGQTTKETLRQRKKNTLESQDPSLRVELPILKKVRRSTSLWCKSEPWTEVKFDDLKNAIPKITFSPAELGVTKGKIVLFGPVGHGKSSFINSVIRIAKCRITKEAPDGSSEGSMTLAYNEFVCDNLLVTEIMGIEARDGLGFNIGNITYLLKGNIQKEYKFDQAHPITPQSPYFNPNPSTADRVYCVIICLKATELAMKPGHSRKIQALLDAADKLQIPRIMILTNIDNLCVCVKKGLRNVFICDIVQQAVDVASKTFKIPLQFVHPVQNLTRETYPEPKKIILLLTALNQALDFAKNCHQRLVQIEKIYKTESVFICQDCNRVCRSRIGLYSHRRRCSSQGADP